MQQSHSCKNNFNGPHMNKIQQKVCQHTSNTKCRPQNQPGLPDWVRVWSRVSCLEICSNAYWYTEQVHSGNGMSWYECKMPCTSVTVTSISLGRLCRFGVAAPFKIVGFAFSALKVSKADIWTPASSVWSLPAEKQTSAYHSHKCSINKFGPFAWKDTGYFQTHLRR